MELNFRTLNADEIECKATIVKRDIEVSLHSKAHTCTRILNETVGELDWEKEYTNGNKNCIVRIWDSDKNRFVSKEDCGGPLTEIDGHKGQASNGFKRVCALGWGLGIELYSQPTILLPQTDENITYDEKGVATIIERYSVKEIEYNDNKQIVRCVIVDSHGDVVYDGPNENGESNVKPPEKKEEILVIPEDADIQCEGAEESYDDDLPDNTDGFESDADECVTQPTPFGHVDYRKALEAEIKRTHVKRSDVLKALKISDFEDIGSADEDLLDETLRRLKAMKTFGK